MSRNQSRPGSVGVSCQNHSAFIESIARSAGEDASDDLEAVVLRAVARHSEILDLPDVLELRTVLDVDLDETAPLEARVATIVDAIEATVASWPQQEAPE
ncbi:hypothetical protein [Haloarcula halophila]|uniref:hypothetical protein n=1 Tax=Haloarcula TaxID=2237 RepID=UPI0023E417D9|nr:hypothetical protein [Halomicroarcula sp. DFY41]